MTTNKLVKTVNTTTIEKLDFEGVDAFHDALCFAFHPDGIEEDEEIDNRFFALWNIFLVSAGWGEGEFWEEYHDRKDHCNECGALMDAEGNHLDEDGDIIEEDNELPPIDKTNTAVVNKPN